MLLVDGDCFLLTSAGQCENVRQGDWEEEVLAE